MEKQPCVYMMSSANKNVLYIGVTSQLKQRVWQHKNNLVEGFTNKYQVHHLVYYEMFESMPGAIAREKQLKGWKREWKNALILQNNPVWGDLYDVL